MLHLEAASLDRHLHLEQVFEHLWPPVFRGMRFAGGLDDRLDEPYRPTWPQPPAEASVFAALRRLPTDATPTSPSVGWAASVRVVTGLWCAGTFAKEHLMSDLDAQRLQAIRDFADRLIPEAFERSYSAYDIRVVDPPGAFDDWIDQRIHDSLTYEYPGGGRQRG